MNSVAPEKSMRQYPSESTFKVHSVTDLTSAPYDSDPLTLPDLRRREESTIYGVAGIAAAAAAFAL